MKERNDRLTKRWQRVPMLCVNGHTSLQLVGCQQVDKLDNCPECGQVVWMRRAS